MQNYFMGQDGFTWFIGVIEDRADPKKAEAVEDFQKIFSNDGKGSLIIDRNNDIKQTK